MMNLNSYLSFAFVFLTTIVLASPLTHGDIEIHDLQNEGTILLLPNGGNLNMKKEERSLATAAAITDATCRLIQDIATIVNATGAAAKHPYSAEIVAFLSNGSLVAVCTQIVQLVEACLPLLETAKSAVKGKVIDARYELLDADNTPEPNGLLARKIEIAIAGVKREDDDDEDDMDEGQRRYSGSWLTGPTGTNMTLKANATALAGGNQTLLAMCQTMGTNLMNMTTTDSAVLAIKVNSLPPGPQSGDSAMISASQKRVTQAGSFIAVFGGLVVGLMIL